MTFRELRALPEALRQLGYPRRVAVDSFRAPNFPLVADVLGWALARVGGAGAAATTTAAGTGAGADDNVGGEAGRLALVGAAVAACHETARVRLCAAALYAADGRAARELLVLARALLAADAGEPGEPGEPRAAAGAATAMAPPTPTPTPTPPPPPPPPPPLAAPLPLRPSHLAALRAGAEELVSVAGQLGALLPRQPALHGARCAAARLLDALAAGPAGGGGGGESFARVERALRDALAAADDDAARAEGAAGELAEDADAVAGRVAARRGELARAAKRLDALAGVAPAHAVEYARLEGELAAEHAAFVTKARNVDFLASELGAQRVREQQRLQAGARAVGALQQQLREAHAAEERGDHETVGDAELAEEEERRAGGGGGSAAHPADDDADDGFSDQQPDGGSEASLFDDTDF